MLQGKKAVSPIISTVLLIVIVIVLAMIILLWTTSFVKEAITKDISGNEKRINEYCLEIRMNPILNEDDSFGFENAGNVPIYSYKVKLGGSGESNIIKFGKDEGGSVNPGYSSIVPGISYSSYESIKIIPILLGKVGADTREFECPESSGIEI